MSLRRGNPATKDYLTPERELRERGVGHCRELQRAARARVPLRPAGPVVPDHQLLTYCPRHQVLCLPSLRYAFSASPSRTFSSCSSRCSSSRVSSGQSMASFCCPLCYRSSARHRIGKSTTRSRRRNRPRRGINRAAQTPREPRLKTWRWCMWMAVHLLAACSCLYAMDAVYDSEHVIINIGVHIICSYN